MSLVTEFKKKKQSFTVKQKDGTELKLAVQRPNQEQLKEAQKVSNTVFNDAIQSKAPVRAQVQDLVKKYGLWDDDKQEEYDVLQKKIMEARATFAKGGKVNELKALALEIKKYTRDLQELTSGRNSLDVKTAEGQAEAARFNKLVSLCTVYDDVGSSGKPYFKNYDDYLERNDEPAAGEAANQLMYIIYNADPNFETNLPENKFLRQWGFVDEKLRPINKDGHLVDDDGTLINEEGRLVDKDGNYVDRKGNRIDKDGNYVTETPPVFTDDDGNVITPPSSPAQ